MIFGFALVVRAPSTEGRTISADAAIPRTGKTVAKSYSKKMEPTAKNRESLNPIRSSSLDGVLAFFHTFSFHKEQQPVDGDGQHRRQEAPPEDLGGVHCTQTVKEDRA